MNYKYVLTKITYYNGKHTRTSYGIAVVSIEDNITILCSIEDITDEQQSLLNSATRKSLKSSIFKTQFTTFCM